MLNTASNLNPYMTYKNAAVETATPEKLLIMLFNGGIKFLRLSIEAINNKDYEAANNNLIKVQDILAELIFTLDIDKGGELAQNLYNLYLFYQNEVIVANIKKDSSKLEPVLEFFEIFRDVWTEASKLSRIGAK